MCYKVHSDPHLSTSDVQQNRCGYFMGRCGSRLEFNTELAYLPLAPAQCIARGYFVSEHFIYHR